MRASEIDFYCIFERIGFVAVCRPFDEGFCGCVAVLKVGAGFSDCGCVEVCVIDLYIKTTTSKLEDRSLL